MIRINKRRYLSSRPLLVLAILFSTGCKKAGHPALVQPQAPSLAMPSAAPKRTENADLNHSIEAKYPNDPAKARILEETADQLNAIGDAEEALAALHHRTMVTPALAEFKPESAERKIRLRLIVEKGTLRSGERPRYRLEMTNVGREPIDYRETHSSFFVKDATLLDSAVMHFILTTPAGTRMELLPARPPRNFESGAPRNVEYLPVSMPQAEKEKWLKAINAGGAAHANFQVKLSPGETLHNIGDDDSPSDNFRTMFTQSKFDKAGIYMLQVEFDDRPKPMSKIYIEASLRAGDTLDALQKSHDQRMRDALGPISSNIARIEVER